MKAVIAAAALLALTACGNHTITGTDTLISANGIAQSGDTCSGSNGFDDMTAGAPVVIRSGSGQIIASTQLSVGHPETGQYSDVTCDFTFSASVPDADFYQISVGHRNPVTYSRDQLDKAGWKVDLSLSDASP